MVLILGETHRSVWTLEQAEGRREVRPSSPGWFSSSSAPGIGLPSPFLPRKTNRPDMVGVAQKSPLKSDKVTILMQAASSADQSRARHCHTPRFGLCSVIALSLHGALLTRMAPPEARQPWLSCAREVRHFVCKHG